MSSVKIVGVDVIVEVKEMKVYVGYSVVIVNVSCGLSPHGIKSHFRAYRMTWKRKEGNLPDSAAKRCDAMRKRAVFKMQRGGKMAQAMTFHLEQVTRTCQMQLSTFLPLCAPSTILVLSSTP